MRGSCNRRLIRGGLPSGTARHTRLLPSSGPATATSSITFGRRDVTDEQLLLTVCGRTATGLPRVVGPCLVGTVTGVGIVCTGAVVDDDERPAHRHRLTLVCGKAVHRSGERAGKFDDRLGGLHLAQHVVDLHGVSGAHQPRDDLGLGESLARVGHGVRLHGVSWPPDNDRTQYASDRSTASRMRSTSGR